jgi:hypothetical protein
MMENANNNTAANVKPPKSALRKWIFRGSLIIVAFLGLYIYWMYYNAYSKGSRIGRDLKISTKGNIFKTCEGYLTEGCRDVIGNSPVFVFSVADENVEKKLLDLQLKPKACIELKYEEYRRTMPWRGDSKYVVIDAIELPSE